MAGLFLQIDGAGAEVRMTGVDYPGSGSDTTFRYNNDGLRDRMVDVDWI